MISENYIIRIFLLNCILSMHMYDYCNVMEKTLQLLECFLGAVMQTRHDRGLQEAMVYWVKCC